MKTRALLLVLIALTAAALGCSSRDSDPFLQFLRDDVDWIRIEYLEYPIPFVAELRDSVSIAELVSIAEFRRGPLPPNAKLLMMPPPTRVTFGTPSGNTTVLVGREIARFEKGPLSGWYRSSLDFYMRVHGHLRAALPDSGLIREVHYVPQGVTTR